LEAAESGYKLEDNNKLTSEELKDFTESKKAKAKVKEVLIDGKKVVLELRKILVKSQPPIKG